MWLHAHYVARYLSFYFSPNTHLTGEALGLFYAGTLFSEFKDASRWRRLGARVLTAESRSQICADGVHFERSTCYHRYTVETYQQFLLLAARNRVPVPADLGDHVRRMVDFMLAVRRPDGALPEIGDADGGRLLPVVERGQCDPRGAFAVAAAMFGRGDFAEAAEGMTPEVPWLMGAEGVRAFAAATPSKPAGVLSRMFPSGGYAVMRTGWERDAHQMIVDVGPLGCSFSAGHGHADLLSIQCSAFGEPVLVDAGTYCYTPETEWRNYLPRHGGAQHGDDRRPRPGRDRGPLRLARTSARPRARVAQQCRVRFCRRQPQRLRRHHASTPRDVREAGLLGRRRRCDGRPRRSARRTSSRPASIRSISDFSSRRCLCPSCAIDGRGRRRRPAIRSGSGRSDRPR